MSSVRLWLAMMSTVVLAGCDDDAASAPPSTAGAAGRGGSGASAGSAGSTSGGSPGAPGGSAGVAAGGAAGAADGGAGPLGGAAGSDAAAGAAGASATPCHPDRNLIGSAWPEADALFHRDPDWLGADAAYSIPLGADRVLWLFGDTFIATSPERIRTQSKFIRNSIAIQRGTNPETADIAFHWRTDADGPQSFFPEIGEHWLWPLQGTRLADGLTLFFFEVAAVSGGFGFEIVGTRAYRVANPDADPQTWTFQVLAFPSHPYGLAPGVALLHEGRDLYLFATVEPGNHDVYLARVSAEPTLDVATPAWWDGQAFRTDSSRSPVWLGGAPEFSALATCSGYAVVESVGFGATEIGVRRAEGIAGPWSAPELVYRPPESDAAQAFVYAGKAHPELRGADLVVTYATNSFDTSVFTNHDLYFPRFVKLNAQ
jgi:hypothetical protein